MKKIELDNKTHEGAPKTTTKYALFTKTNKQLSSILVVISLAHTLRQDVVFIYLFIVNNIIIAVGIVLVFVDIVIVVYWCCCFFVSYIFIIILLPLILLLLLLVVSVSLSLS